MLLESETEGEKNREASHSPPQPQQLPSLMQLGEIANRIEAEQRAAFIAEYESLLQSSSSKPEVILHFAWQAAKAELPREFAAVDKAAQESVVQLLTQLGYQSSQGAGEKGSCAAA